MAAVRSIAVVELAGPMTAFPLLLASRTQWKMLTSQRFQTIDLKPFYVHASLGDADSTSRSWCTAHEAGFPLSNSNLSGTSAICPF